MFYLLLAPILLFGLAALQLLGAAIKAPSTTTITALAIDVLIVYLLVRLFLALRRRSAARRAKRAAVAPQQTKRGFDKPAASLPESPAKQTTAQASPAQAQPARQKPATIYRDKVKGTSYRQANLKKASGWIRRDELLDWSLARDSYQGEPSIRVMVARMGDPSPALHLGYIAREDVEILLPYVDTCAVEGEVYGGPTVDAPEKSYGAYIRVYPG